MIPDTYTIIPELIPTLNFGFEWKGFDARAVFTAYLNRDVFLSPAVAWSGWGNLRYPRSGKNMGLLYRRSA